MEGSLLSVLAAWTNAGVLVRPVWAAVSCSEVDRHVLVAVLEEAPDDRIDARVRKKARSIRTSAEQRSSLLSIWENVWISSSFFWVHAWNPDFTPPSSAVLQDLPAVEAV